MIYAQVCREACFRSQTFQNSGPIFLVSCCTACCHYIEQAEWSLHCFSELVHPIWECGGAQFFGGIAKGISLIIRSRQFGKTRLLCWHSHFCCCSCKSECSKSCLNNVSTLRDHVDCSNESRAPAARQNRTVVDNGVRIHVRRERISLQLLDILRSLCHC